MGSLGRKISRKKKLKELKESKKNLKKVLNATSGLPSECSVCSAVFDSKNDADTWMVSVDDAVALFCPECWENRD